MLLMDKSAVCESSIALLSHFFSHQNYSRNTAQHKGRQEACTSSFWYSAEQVLAVGSQHWFCKQSLEVVYISQKALQVALALSFQKYKPFRHHHTDLLYS